MVLRKGASQTENLCLHRVPEHGTPRGAKGRRREQQLLGTAAFYADDTMTLLPQFTSDGRVDTIVVPGQSVFSNIHCAAFDSCILHRKTSSA
jgi:hypothetical protein